MATTFSLLMATFAVYLIITTADGRHKCGPSSDSSSELPNCTTSENTNCLKETKYADECFTNGDCHSVGGILCCRGPCGNNECSIKRYA